MSEGEAMKMAPDYSRLGYALAARVLQSDLYGQLDDVERAQCDELLAPVAQDNGELVKRLPDRLDAYADAATDGQMRSDLYAAATHVRKSPPYAVALSRQPANAAGQEVVALESLDTPERVCFYEQEFYVLSNFSSFRLQWRGRDFDTSEHAYHWSRFEGTDAELQDAVMAAPSAHEAFKLAQDHKLFQRTDWDEIKVGVMLDILRAKADQHEYVRRKLLQTGDRLLVENSWRDSFWGCGPNKDGKNMLGNLWMKVRAELLVAQVPGVAG